MLNGTFDDDVLVLLFLANCRLRKEYIELKSTFCIKCNMFHIHLEPLVTDV